MWDVPVHERVTVKELHLKGSRREIRDQAADEALKLALECILPGVSRNACLLLHHFHDLHHLVYFGRFFPAFSGFQHLNNHIHFVS